MHILVMDILDHRLYLAPMPETPKKVMDIATGIGLWAIEMGDRNPDTCVLGLDLSPIQPTSVPPNVTFQIDDIEDTWVHDNDFDLIHMREAAAYMTQTPKVIESALAHLKPGGWFELQEFHWVAEKDDGEIDPNNPINIFLDRLIEAAKKEGINVPIVPTIGDIMRRAGYVDVEKKTFRVPYGTWSTDIAERRRGACFTVNADLLLPAYSHLLSNVGIEHDQAENLYDDIFKAINDDTLHIFATYHVWYGRKPSDESRSSAE
ncbi:S-adenosyl-L-methionine-dependent methyltransferase [Poronia punctata]|nr:S-adenosyl-L-methionine-dependent methyltransferase [Poronia punctata]